MKIKIAAFLSALAAASFTAFHAMPVYGISLLGDINSDGTVNTDDASLVLNEYALRASGAGSYIRNELADIDSDGAVTITDASYLLTYYAQYSAGMNVTLESILGIEETIDVNVSMTGLNSTYALLMDAQTGKVIAEKNGYSTIYPASMTKIMTAIVTIENFPDVNQYVTLPSSAVNAAISRGGSRAGFSGGAYVPMLDLLYGMLLPSGCECCIGAAIIISGSESAFVDLMNQKAQELGMTGTHYANCTGLPNSNHYTTVHDMAVLMRYAIKNDIFRQVDMSQNHTAVNGLYMRSTMFKSLINNYGSTAVTGGNILGGKTGTTSAAGSCLCSFAEIGGREYVLCTSKAAYSGLNIADARTVYNRLGNALAAT